MSVLLKKPIFDEVSNKELAEQLEARKKCEKKLPTWFRTAKIYYPKKLSIEQTSSEITAWYKSQIVSGKTLFDTTGGLGVDSYYFSKKIEQIFHCEIDPNLAQIAAHNFEILGAHNIKCIPTDGLDYLKNLKTSFNWIYLDPSRRDDKKGKVFRLSECRPDVPENLDLLFDKSDNILLKTSPLLDFTIGIRELRFVKEIHVVAVKNEVKELLWILEKQYTDEILVKTVNFLGSSPSDFPSSESGTSRIDFSQIPREIFNFRLSEEKNTFSEISDPLSYLYEPNAAILKSGAFKTIGSRFQLKKLDEHTHLYTSRKSIPFPGRRFKIKNIFSYDRKSIKSLGIKKANITTRNFPESVASLRKRFSIEDGGNTYLFFTTTSNGEKIVLQCRKSEIGGVL